MKKTAVDYLQDEILQDRMIKAKSIKEWNDVIIKAREMEKQQIMEAVIFGDCRGRFTKYLTDEQYYNETYRSNDSDDHIPDVRKMIEISDEEIMNGAIENCEKKHEWWSLEVNAMVAGAKWYREQLKSIK